MDTGKLEILQSKLDNVDYFKLAIEHATYKAKTNGNSVGVIAITSDDHFKNNKEALESLLNYDKFNLKTFVDDAYFMGAISVMPNETKIEEELGVITKQIKSFVKNYKIVSLIAKEGQAYGSIKQDLDTMLSSAKVVSSK